MKYGSRIALLEHGETRIDAGYISTWHRHRACACSSDEVFRRLNDWRRSVRRRNGMQGTKFPPGEMGRRQSVPSTKRQRRNPLLRNMNYIISNAVPQCNITSLLITYRKYTFYIPIWWYTPTKNTWIINFKSSWRITMKIMALPTPLQFPEGKSRLHKSTIQRFLPLLTNALDAHKWKIKQ